MNRDPFPMTLKPGHTLIGETCYGCGKPFDDKEPICLVAIGCGDDPEARAAARQGRMYNVVAIPLHYACHTGIENPDDDLLQL